MNLNIVEKITREVQKSNLVARNSRPVEHRSLSSLSTQIAANLRAGNSANPAIPAQVYSLWI
ncbi:MAG TPA: hypothetical protein VLQ48_06660 [Chloroflexia bacterium]|jgi:hypothetical protein|nr:hypothetical protein [Chloroflexia bacterium]